jgi:hypothetical protein
MTMTTSADRSTINRALAKAIAYKNCGQDEKAYAWAAKLVDLLECNDILTNRAFARTIGLEG